MDYYHWGYYLTRKELTDLYKSCQGTKFGTFNPTSLMDILHARRAIYKYLLPGPIRVWLAGTEEDDGVVFFVGKPNCHIRKSVKLDLADRCVAMFGGPPCLFTVVPGSDGQIYEVVLRDGKLYNLDLVEFLQSDTEGDKHPLRIGEIPPEQRHLLGLS